MEATIINTSEVGIRKGEEGGNGEQGGKSDFGEEWPLSHVVAKAEIDIDIATLRLFDAQLWEEEKKSEQSVIQSLASTMKSFVAMSLEFSADNPDITIFLVSCAAAAVFVFGVSGLVSRIFPTNSTIVQEAQQQTSHRSKSYPSPSPDFKGSLDDIEHSAWSACHAGNKPLPSEKVATSGGVDSEDESERPVASTEDDTEDETERSKLNSRAAARYLPGRCGYGRIQREDLLASKQEEHSEDEFELPMLNSGSVQ